MTNQDMNMNQPKITSDKIIEEQEKLKEKYEVESKTKDQEILNLKNKITKKNDEIFELQKANESLVKDRDEWKSATHAARKVQSETKQHKEQQDFNSAFIKLQAKKGWQWDESQGWTKA